jgi:hypothetical protein
MSSGEVLKLAAGSPRRSLLLDANLLLLWITSQYDLRLLRTFKRVQMFSQSDAVLLAWLIDRFQGIVTTSHVVTEASNLANALSSGTRSAWFALLAEFVGNTNEFSPPLKLLARKEEFVRFGATDSALAELADDHQIVTTDYRLSGYLHSAGKQVLNFSDLRKLGLGKRTN